MIGCFSSRVLAQCSFPAGIANGACTGTAATDGVSINSGQTYSWSGSGTFNNVTINSGGVLQICGTLTINSLNFNGGDIVVMSGGALTLASASLNGGPPARNITNYGTLTINSNFSINAGNAVVNYGTLNVMTSTGLQGTGAVLANGSSSAVINFNNNSLTLDAMLVNLGTISGISSLNINSGSSICAGPGSGRTADCPGLRRWKRM